MPTHYETLGVAPASEPEVIEAAYKALIRKYHPDRAGDNDRIRQINVAYGVLRSPIKRRAYDATLKLFPSKELVVHRPKPDARQRSKPRSRIAEPPGRLEKTCPECLELVARGASVCKHCGHRFGVEPQSWRERNGTGCVIFLILALLFVMFLTSLAEDPSQNQLSGLNEQEAGTGIEGAATDEGQPLQIPLNYQGRWGETQDACEKGPVMMVTADAVGSEEPAALVALEDPGDGNATMTFKALNAQPFKQFWVVRGDGMALRVDGDGYSTSYVRCPDPRVAKLKESEEAPMPLGDLRIVKITAPTVPAVYRGRWAISAPECHSAQGAKRITEAGDTGRAAGDLVAVSQLSALSANMTFSMADGRGQFNYTERWTISSDQSQLFVDSIEDRSHTEYVRCPPEPTG